MTSHTPDSPPTTQTYRPLQADDAVALCIRRDASGLALFEEAERRQHAAQQLANTLGCLDGMGSASEAQLHGCFLALRLLLDDASALYAAARTAQRHSR